MNRWLAVLAAVPALAFAVEAASWSARRDAFEKAAREERKKLGLDDDQDALYARYPTPEVTFAGGGAVVCPGQTAEVRLAGKLPQGSLVLPRSASVEVVKERRTGAGWEGTVRAARDAAPEEIGLEAISPVSGAQVSLGGLAVGCRHTFTLEAGGDTLVLRTEFGREGTVRAAGEWRQGGKALGSLAYRVTRHAGSLEVVQDATVEDQQAQMSGFQEVMGSKAWKDLDARTQAAMKKLEPCGKLPPEKMAACFAAPQKEMEALAKEREALVAQAERRGAPAFGCRNLHLRVGAGAVEGDAEGCAGKRTNERMPVKGRYTAG
jgi:hypothetical protein